MKKCINRRCNKELPDDYSFCPYCGKNQEQKPQRQKKRPNGTGSIYVRKDNKSKPYAAASSITGKQVYLGSFATRTEAVQALKEYEYNPITAFNITLDQLHDEWQTITYKKLGVSVQQNYNAAWVKLKPLYNRKFRDIRTGEMQAIIDYYEAPHHETGTDGKLKYMDDKGKGTYNVTDTPKMSDGLKFSALHKIKCLLTSMYGTLCKTILSTKTMPSLSNCPRKTKQAVTIH